MAVQGNRRKQQVNPEMVRRIAQRENLLRSQIGNPQRQCVGKVYSKFILASLSSTATVGP